MEKVEQEELEEMKKKLNENEQDPKTKEKDGLAESSKEKKEGINIVSAGLLKPEDVQLDFKEEGIDKLKRSPSGQSLKKKTSIVDLNLEANKNIEGKRKTLVSQTHLNGGSVQQGGGPNLAVIQPQVPEVKPEPKRHQKPREETQDFRLIKMQSGESMQLIETSLNNLKQGKQPQPKGSAIKPGKQVPGDNPNQLLTSTPILPAKVSSVANLDNNFKPVEGKFMSEKVLVEPRFGIESKPTTANDQNAKVQVIKTKVDPAEKKQDSAADNQKILQFKKPGDKEGKDHNDNDYLGFPTINEQTEPDPSAPDRKSLNHYLEMSSKNKLKPGLGESSLNFQLSVSPMTDKNMVLLRQNLEDRNEIAAKPNFSCALLSKDVLQIIKMEEIVNRRDEINKEIVLLDMKKHEELYEMVRTDQYRHSQTQATRVAGGWMEFEAEGEAWKDRG